MLIGDDFAILAGYILRYFTSREGDPMALLILSLLFVKHFIFDFLWQTPSEVANKGTYGNLKGLAHSLKHTFGQ